MIAGPDWASPQPVPASSGEKSPTAGPPQPAAGRDERHDETFRRNAFRDFDLLYTVAALTTGSRGAARTVLPEVMTAAYRQWHTRPVDEEPRVWLLRLLADRLPAEGSGGTTPLSSPGSPPLPGATLAHDPDLQRVALSPAVIRQAIRQLPQADRAVLALSEIAGLSYAQVAAVLDVTRAVARDRLHRARSALKARLSRMAEGSGGPLKEAAALHEQQALPQKGDGRQTGGSTTD